MERWEVVAEVGSLADREMLAVRCSGRNLIVYRTARGWFATERRCTHQGADLMRGYLEGESIECPMHQGRFDIRTGAALNAPACTPLAVYTVRVHDDRIEIKVG